jgi:BirA family biotin operon repressor/biotin-[acetyl-CoA-carboxylase] ligase
MRKYSDASGEFTGKIVDVENDGHLIIEDMEGHKRRYAFKEVTFLIIH